MKVGSLYSRKIETNNYSVQLQDAICEACEFCLQSSTSGNAASDETLMLLGKIQSGKTRAYVGLISLAFDSGFDLTIILTKNSAALVKQTYKRMKLEFSNEIRDNVVEILDVMKNVPDDLTDYEINKKVIVVLKKEHRNLDRILSIVDKYALSKRKNCLIIDDEADSIGIGYSKSRDSEDEFFLRKIASKINELRGSLKGCAFVQVTATPYALYLQPEFNIDEIKPIKPQKTILIPSGEGYVGGDYYFVESRNENHRARFIYESVTDEENAMVSDQRRKVKTKLEDRRIFKIENIITNEKILPMLKRSIVNFIVGGCVLRCNNSSEHFAFVIHTAIKKSSHDDLFTISKEFVEQIKNRDQSPPFVIEIITRMLKKSYEDIKSSYIAYGFEMPMFEIVQTSFYRAIDSGWVSFSVVNSDKEIDSILDEDSGELRLRTPFSIFIGGQVLDRGVTIPQMIGFYYGRNPITMQQDTVMQHSRMFGYRNNDLLSVTRFYTTNRIFESLTRITEIDRDLRENIQQKNFSEGVYFLARSTSDKLNESSRIVPCAPNKIALSNMVFIKSNSRLLPVGFSVLPEYKTKESRRSIVQLLDKLNVETCDNITISVSKNDCVDFLRLIYSLITPDEMSMRYISAEQFISALNYLAPNTSSLKMYIRFSGSISKYKANGTTLQDAPDTGYELAGIRVEARTEPVIMVIKQDGVANGWGNRDFWWPILVAPKTAKATVFSLSEPIGSVRC